MAWPQRSTPDRPCPEPAGPLQTILSGISRKCTNCPSCREECAFLRKRGTPKEIADAWGAARKSDANGKRRITFCAGCASRLNGTVPTDHIVDFLLEPEAALAGNARVSRPPFTYLNRLNLKRRLRKMEKAWAPQKGRS